MKKLTLAVIAAALAWSAYWMYASGQSRSGTEDWFTSLQSRGWTARYDDLSVRGFPNRVDQEITNITLSNPDRSLEWEAPFLQVFQLVYNPDHLILAFPDRHTLRTPLGDWQIEDQGLRASVVRENDSIARINAEADTLNLTGDASVAMADVTAAVLQDPLDRLSYRLALQIGALALGAATPNGLGLPDGANSVQADMTVRFDTAWTQDTLDSRRPQPTALDIRLAEYRVGDTRVKLAGDLNITGSGTPEGEVSLQVENWRDLLREIERTGQVPASVLEAAEALLSQLARLNGNAQTLDVDLRLANGRVLLGFIPIAPAPSLRLP